ncbi:MAG: oligosaccharide flippase family protein [Clostridia bacterium]|nr:oligosaccharide flippase family protein [Clostridia bacterium]
MKNNNIQKQENIEEQSNRRIKLGVFMSYITIAVNIITGLLYTPWMLKQIGDSNYGLYTLASSFISMFMLDFGMSAAVSRFVSRYIALDDQDSLNNFLGIVYKLYGLISAAISVILIVVFFNLNTIYDNMSAAELATFKVVFVMTAFSTVFCFPFVTLSGIMMSYEYFFEIKLFNLLNKICTVVLTIIALIEGMGIYALVAVHAVCNITFVLVKLVFIKRKTSIKINWKVRDKEQTKGIFSFSIWSAISGVAQQLTLNIMPSILAALVSASQLAHFSLARTIEGYVWTISEAINGLFLPKVTRRIVKSDTAEDVLPLMIKVGRIILSITGLVICGIILVGQDFVKVWLGSNGYNDVYIMMILLTVYSIISSPQQIANTSMVVLNKVRYQATVAIVCSILNIVIAPVFIKIYGAVGAAMSVGAAYIIRVIISNVIYYKVLKVNVFKFFWECHIKMLPGFLIAIIVSVIAGRIINFDSNVLNMFAKGIIFVLAYTISMWFIGWNNEEKNLIKSVIKR